jgi:rhodanese-related sulfurtransferase
MKQGGSDMLTDVVLSIVLLGLFFGRPGSRVNVVSARETFDRVAKDSSIVLLDVRTKEEYNAGHLSQAVLIPLQELERRIGELEPLKERNIIAYCRSGNRSGKAAEMLGKKGFTVLNMEGGILKWNELRLPIVQGETK